MELVPATIIWKIVFPAATVCLAKAAMEPRDTTETMDEKATSLPDTHTKAHAPQGRMDLDAIHTGTVTSVGNAVTIIGVLSSPKESATTIALENTTELPRSTIPIPVIGSTNAIDRDSTIVNEPGGSITGIDTSTGVSFIAYERAPPNLPENVMHTASVVISYAIYTATPGSGGATTPDADPETNTGKASGFLKETSTDQDDVLLAENPGSTTPLSPETMSNITTGKTSTQGQDKAVDMVTVSESAPRGLPDNTQGDPACYPECDVIPPWATVILCLGTAFFIFTLVDLLFLLPYCTKFRRPTAASCSSSPRYSV